LLKSYKVYHFFCKDGRRIPDRQDSIFNKNCGNLNFHFKLYYANIGYLSDHTAHAFMIINITNFCILFNSWAWLGVLHQWLFFNAEIALLIYLIFNKEKNKQMRIIIVTRHVLFEGKGEIEKRLFANQEANRN